MLQGRGRFVSATCVAIALGAVAAAAQRADKRSEPKADQAAGQAQQAVIHAADAAMAGQAAPSDFPIQFQNDFLRAQGTAVWVPFTLTMDAAKITGPVTLYLRAVPRGMTAPPGSDRPEKGRDKPRPKKGDQKRGVAADDSPTYPYHQLESLDLKPEAPGQPVRVIRGIALQPGSYDLYVVVRERPLAAPPSSTNVEPPLKTSVLKQPLDVPDYSNGQLSTSTVILADRVEQLQAPVPSTEQGDHPYAFGQTQIVVSPDRRFKKSQELVVLLQIYNPTLSADKNFNLEATYTFFQEGAGGEKRFNATEPQELTADTMNGSDLSKTSIQAGQAIPLESFPDGPYRLEIKVTDKLSSKVVTQSATFTVTPP